MENYDNFIAIDCHTSGSVSTSWTIERANWYGVTGLPTTWFDGVLECVGAYYNDTQDYNWFEDQYDARKNVPTDVTISLLATETDPNTYLIRATVGIEAGGTAKNMVVHIVQVIDNYPYTADNRWVNTVRQNSNNRTVSLTPGTYDTVEWTVALTGDNWIYRDRAKIIAWARDTGAPPPDKEVHQAAQLLWPFAEGGCAEPGVSGNYCMADVYPSNGDGSWSFADDGDCVIDLSDLGELLPNYGTTTGMTREDGDVYPPGAGDGSVDLSDLGELLAQYGDDCN